MQLVQFEATRYIAVMTLTLIREGDDGRAQLLVAPLASVSTAVTGLVVFLAALAGLAARLKFAAGAWLNRLAGVHSRLAGRGQALCHRAAILLVVSRILGRAFAWALLDL